MSVKDILRLFKMLKIINPTTEELLATLSVDDEASIQHKMLQAKRAQADWAEVPLRQRIDVICQFADRLQHQKHELALLLTREMGKPITQSIAEITSTLQRIQFFVEHVARMSGDEDWGMHGGVTEKVSYEALGVIANISAWNYPYFVGSNVFVPALLCGNAVLYKPSELTTLTGLKIAELLHASGVPQSIFTTVIGRGDQGTALLAGDIDGVFFTGSYKTGVNIKQTVARKMIPLQLELGGKDSVYVCDDVDIAKAVSSVADGAFYNTGQSCCAVERIYVHQAVYSEFIERFIEEVKGFVIGNPEDEKTYIGPLARQPQVDVLQRQVTDAAEKGAHVAAGGSTLGRRGYYFAPTVLLYVDHTMAVMRDESFGPIIGIQRVLDDNEALRLMNDSEYGLTAAVYSQNEQRARAILRKLKVGSAYWNCCDRVSPRLPWLGHRHSGVGVTLSLQGIRAFLTPKAWHIRA